jgi:uncharacterized membrane protein
MLKKLTFIISLIIFLSLFSLSVFAQSEEAPLQEEILEGRIVEILEEDVITQNKRQNLYQKLKVLVTQGSLKGKEVEIEVGDIPIVGLPKYDVGDEVLISRSFNLEGKETFFIVEFVRRGYLLWLFLIFVILAVVVGRWRGATSLLGLGISFLVIFAFILPQINAGRDPVTIAIIGSLMIIPATFYLSHGFNRKTTIAMMGTLAALVITGFLAKCFVEAARLTGYASEEAAFLQSARPGIVNIRGLVLAGIIIGALGVLDDITVAQSAIVQQLREASPKIKFKELFLRAMNVGQDHIASMINTLVLVYTGAALPLLLLFINNPQPFSQVINYEIVAEEIIRTLVGSIGLITAVPITTFLATYLGVGKKKGK